MLCENFILNPQGETLWLKNVMTKNFLKIHKNPNVPSEEVLSNDIYFNTIFFSIEWISKNVYRISFKFEATRFTRKGYK